MSKLSESLKELDAPVIMTLRDYNKLRRRTTTITALQILVEALRNPENKQTLTIHVCKPHVLYLEHFMETENSYVVLSVTYLRGSAFLWLQPYLEFNIYVLMLDNLNLFFEKLPCVFGNSNQAATAKIKPVALSK
ncbi:hypothetical protein BB561_002974 [Smittium simulii]|uniref:Uncharacterized protein n=1 Tax=Smittium simulii TaxID=133385 RepID=A0A2T9YNH1_9FUNG|nr:hypothetical protein BB561_002974 [Smittium simulii]